MKPEFVYNSFPYPFLIQNLEKLGIGDFTVFFFPYEYTRIIKYIRTGERMKKRFEDMMKNEGDEL